MTTRRWLLQCAVAEVLMVAGAVIYGKPAAWLFTLVPVAGAAAALAFGRRS